MLRKGGAGGFFPPAPPVFVLPSDASLPIIGLTYRLVLEVNRAVGELPRSQRPGLGRRSEATAFHLLRRVGGIVHLVSTCANSVRGRS